MRRERRTDDTGATWISASEAGYAAFCPRAAWFQAGGAPRDAQARAKLARGTRAHRRWTRSERRRRWAVPYGVVALLTVALALLWLLVGR